jgi:hypothetical protein
MAMLERAGVRRVGAEEAKLLCHLAETGLWLPYRDWDGRAVRDGDRDYGRLRLDTPQEKKKYHQAAGTSVHAYVPPGLADVKDTGGDLFLIEGEFKSLALAEAGFAAVGISGFYGFASPGGARLVPELAAVMAQRQPARILFCGDSDTALNASFSVAAARLANLVKPLPLLLPRIPMNGPGKGADDCREALGPEFVPWWLGRVAQAVAVSAPTSPLRLALSLFEAEAEGLAGLVGAARLDAEQRLVHLAAALKRDPLVQGRVLKFAVEKLGLARRELNRAVTALEKQASGRQGSQAIKGSGRVIEHDQPAAVWTRQAWEAIADSVFWYAGNVCRFHDGQLQPQSPAQMVSFLDNPDRCRFQTRNRNGEEVASSFTEADARIFLGAWMDVPDLVRVVDVVSNVPVLAWNGEAAVLVNSYDRDLRILAGGAAVTLPSPKEAVCLLARLLRDYDFVTAGDLGRAIALLLSPALAQGGFLGKGRVPLFLVEKNEASAGGSLLLRLASQIYGLRPQPISKLDNSKAVEDLSRLLLGGSGFIYFDNARGKGLQNLPELESLLTEPVFNCRAPYKHGEADVTRRVMAVSSNGAVFSRDLATRTAKITIRKRPSNHVWATYAEGSIEDHVVANMGVYLGAVFSLVKDWADQGRPGGSNLTGFRFTQWERACAWILQRHFPGLPLLDASHKEAQDRLADPDHDLLRNLLRLVVQGESRGELTASSLAEIGAEAGLLDGEEQQNRLKVGKAMKRRFPHDGEHTFDGGRFTVTRDTRMSNNGNGHEVAYYEIRTGGCNE